MLKPMHTNPNTETFKFCPQCGSSSLTANDSKSFVCKNCEFTFYINTAAATAGLIFDAQNQLLVTIRKSDPAKGTYDLPGGFSDPKEKIEETLAREVKEELNLNVSNIKYFGSEPNDYSYKNVNYTTLDMIFTCKVKDFENIKANDDVADFLFIPLKNLDEKDFGLKSIKNVVKKIKSELSNKI